jgi:hypothetical protein
MITRKSKAGGALMRITAMLGVLLVAAEAVHAQGVVLPLPPDDQQRITAQLGPGVVGNPVPSQAISSVAGFFPLQNHLLTYQVTAGSNLGDTQTLGVLKARRPSGKQAWRFMLSPSLSGFLRQNSSGDIVMPAVSDSKEGVVIVTTPANPFVPNGMQPGETRSYSQQVSVNYLDDPSDQEYSGSLNGTYTYVGTYQVTVPAGTYNAVLLKVRCEGKVGPAHTVNIGYTFFAPGVGVVAMILQEDVTAFWLFNIDSTTGKVLLFD